VNNTHKHAFGVKINILKTPESDGRGGVQAVERLKISYHRLDHTVV